MTPCEYRLVISYDEIMCQSKKFTCKVANSIVAKVAEEAVADCIIKTTIVSKQGLVAAAMSLPILLQLNSSQFQFQK